MDTPYIYTKISVLIIALLLRVAAEVKCKSKGYYKADGDFVGKYDHKGEEFKYRSINFLLIVVVILCILY